MLAKHSRALQTHRSPATIVVRARRDTGTSQRTAIARVIMSGDQHNALCIFRIRASQYRVHICDFNRRRNTFAGGLREAISLDFKTTAAVPRVALELALDP